MGNMINMAVATDTNVFQIVGGEYDNLVGSIITDYQAAERFENDKWADTVMAAYNSGATDSDTWKEYYVMGEEENVQKREAAGEVVKRTKAGKIVASKAFPSTWNTDKAIVGKALDAGVSLVDVDGNPVPKDKLQVAYKEVDTKADKLPMEKLITVANTWNALYAQLDTDEGREYARGLINK